MRWGSRSGYALKTTRIQAIGIQGIKPDVQTGASPANAIRALMAFAGEAPVCTSGLMPCIPIA